LMFFWHAGGFSATKTALGSTRAAFKAGKEVSLSAVMLREVECVKWQASCYVASSCF